MIRRVRSSLLHTSPFFAAVIRNLELVILDEVGVAEFAVKQRMAPEEVAMATDGQRLIVSESWMSQQTDAFGEWVHKHEVMHIVNQHTFRRYGRNPKGWNIACDLAINHLLRNERGFDAEKGLVPGEGMFKDLPVGLSAEAYYDRLKQMAQEQSSSGSGSTESGSQASQDGADGGQSGSEGDPSQGECQPTDGDPSDPSDPSGSDGSSGTPFEELVDAIMDQFDVSQVLDSEPDKAAGETIEGMKQQWKEVIGMAASVAEQAGKDPAWLMEAVSDVLQAPKLNWKKAMSQFARKMVSSGTNWKRLSRRHGWRDDVVLPARGSYGLTRFMYVCDTSGSMGQEGLNKQFSAWNDILKTFRKVKMIVAHADTRLIPETVQEITQRDLPLKAPDVGHWKGRGGTDFRDVFKVAKRLRVRGLVYYTDGYGTFPDPSEVTIPVLWVVTEDGANDDAFPFGKVVRFAD